jgi:hypothetical protein
LVRRRELDVEHIRHARGQLSDRGVGAAAGVRQRR